MQTYKTAMKHNIATLESEEETDLGCRGTRHPNHADHDSISPTEPTLETLVETVSRTTSQASPSGVPYRRVIDRKKAQKQKAILLTHVFTVSTLARPCLHVPSVHMTL